MKIPVEEQYKYVKLTLPDGSKAEGQAVLLHACCAPCSAAIVECMLRNGMKPTVYFSNSNIYPQQEYDVRKHELKRFLEAQNVPYVEDEYDHHEWLSVITGLEDEPSVAAVVLSAFSSASLMQPSMRRSMDFTFLLLCWHLRAGRISGR